MTESTNHSTQREAEAALAQATDAAQSMARHHLLSPTLIAFISALFALGLALEHVAETWIIVSLWVLMALGLITESVMSRRFAAPREGSLGSVTAGCYVLLACILAQCFRQWEAIDPWSIAAKAIVAFSVFMLIYHKINDANLRAATAESQED